MTAAAHTPSVPTVHPVWLRLTHWLNVAAVFVMVTSGWRIYDASPLFDFRFPRAVTIGGWLGGALQWHFAGMWLLSVNGCVYLLLNLLTGRHRTRFGSLGPANLFADARAALAGRLLHHDLSRYNSIQQLAYVGAWAAIVLAVVSGLVVWKPVQLHALRELLGDYEQARLVHFVAMCGLVGFTAGHLVMAALFPRTLVAMLRGH